MRGEEYPTPLAQPESIRTGGTTKGREIERVKRRVPEGLVLVGVG